VKLLYFGWVRSRIGISGEDIELPDGVGTVQELVDWLKLRSPEYAAALDDITAVRVAVNQELIGLDEPVKGDDEIALFPPMTGG